MEDSNFTLVKSLKLVLNLTEMLRGKALTLVLGVQGITAFGTIHLV